MAQFMSEVMITTKSMLLPAHRLLKEAMAAVVAADALLLP
jgi:hypothetical protein